MITPEKAKKELIKYVNSEKERSLQLGDDTYFFTSWMKANIRKYLEINGIITRMGTVSELESQGIRMPGYPTFLCYKVNKSYLEESK